MHEKWWTCKCPLSRIGRRSTVYSLQNVNPVSCLLFAIFLYAVGLTITNINGQLNRRSDSNGRQFTFLHIHGAVSFVR